MTAAQVREAARLLDLQRVDDSEIVALVDLGRSGANLRIGPLELYPRSKPLSMLPKRFLIARDGASSEEAWER